MTATTSNGHLPPSGTWLWSVGFAGNPLGDRFTLGRLAVSNCCTNPLLWVWWWGDRMIPDADIKTRDDVRHLCRLMLRTELRVQNNGGEGV